MELNDFLYEYQEQLRKEEYNRKRGIEETTDDEDELYELEERLTCIQRNCYLNSKRIRGLVDEMKALNNPELESIIDRLTRTSWDVQKGIYHDVL